MRSRSPVGPIHRHNLLPIKEEIADIGPDTGRIEATQDLKKLLMTPQPCHLLTGLLVATLVACGCKSQEFGPIQGIAQQRHLDLAHSYADQGLDDAALEMFEKDLGVRI